MLVAQLSEALKARPEELPERVHDLVERLRAAEKEVQRGKAAQVLAPAGRLAEGAEDVAGVAFGGHHAEGAAAGDVRTLALDVRGRLPGDRPGAVAVVGSADGKASVVVAVNDAARARGVSAGSLVRVAAAALGGKGGGKDDVAQGGGSEPARAGQAVQEVRRALAASLA